MPKHPKRPRDPNQLAKLVVDLLTGNATEEQPEVESRAAETGRMGGLRGGRKRAASMTPEQRQESARKAAQARWAKG